MRPWARPRDPRESPTPPSCPAACRARRPARKPSIRLRPSNLHASCAGGMLLSAPVRLLESLGVELPVVQAGMGGGIARHELAAAVSDAGGLGTIGLLDPPPLRREIGAARSATSRPLAVNLLLPFVRRTHRELAAQADLVVTFWGPPRRPTGRPWLHQCGSLEEALAARAAGADGVIVQGVEAGGHVRGG